MEERAQRKVAIGRPGRDCIGRWRCTVRVLAFVHPALKMRVRLDELLMDGLPIVDIASLGAGDSHFDRIAAQLDRACCEFGFFYVIGHGIDPALIAALEALARRFFAQPVEHKLEIAMTRGGRAWRGYFPLGGELTSGRPDRKEGLYFGTELGPQDARVQAGWPLHGMNLYPDLPEFRARLMAYLEAVTSLGQKLLGALAHGLGLQRNYFLDHYTGDPTILLRIFNYPPAQAAEDLGVGEHTDYGLLTLLRQDDVGGLEVWNREGWLAAPPVPDSFVCNVGDMLERLTAGRYVSALHRVHNVTAQNRISIALFLDPGFDAVLEPIVTAAAPRGTRIGPAARRWDGTDLATVSGTYGDYLLGKVAKVFPDLGQRHLK